MKPTTVPCTLLALALAWCTAGASAATPGFAAMAPHVPQSAVTVSASANTSVPNDRMQAWLRAEAESPEATTAANQVNTLMGKALARARTVPGVTASTSGYSTMQIAERGRPARWRVVQTVVLVGTDFPAMATLLTRLQEQDGLLLSGMNFSLSPAAREQAERSLVTQAIRTWQTRAQLAASSLGFDGWKPGQVSVQTSEGGRVFPTMRAAGVAMATEMAPVATESGMSEVTVTVTGEALLEGVRLTR